MASVASREKSFRSRLEWDPALKRLISACKSYYVKSDHFELLISQANELGLDIVYSAIPGEEKDDFLDRIVSVVEALESTILKDAVTGETPRPVEYAFADQAKVTECLHSMWTATRDERIKHTQLSLLLQMLLLRSKQAFDTTRYRHNLVRGQIEDEMREVVSRLDLIASGSPPRKEKYVTEDQKSWDEKMRERIAFVHFLDREVDSPELEECLQRTTELDLLIRKKLVGLLADIKEYEKRIKSTEPPISRLTVEEAKYLRDAQYAHQLAVLKDPFDFFELPGEVRNLIYEMLFKFPGTITLTTTTPNDTQCGDSRTYRMWLTPAFHVSRQFRQEAAGYFYGRNTFSCQTFQSVKRSLGMKVLDPELKKMISTITLTWTSFAKSTFKAVWSLLQLSGLRTVNIYVNWDHVFDFKLSTRSGVDQFKFLVSLQTRLPDVQVKVFQFELLQGEKERAISQIPSQSRSMYNHSRKAEEDLVLNNALSKRLIAVREPGSEEPVDMVPFSGYASAKEESQKVRLMTRAELDSKLEEVMIGVRAREIAEELRYLRYRMTGYRVRRRVSETEQRFRIQEARLIGEEL